ncbi:unnamed protein product [Lepeophtheirus salmonis]|uniref:(salmon louse) hypothetical protein n=1 Tax=Lepeophtheirus salmonis TaxID=72036 RepID=A0A7R8CXV8_LEPSM|nr:unnamed protein product [Lepeophtheirus salmonis]CAF2965708.1 unnamed protein product [Lepeophtheirus salmonis]
MKSLVLSIERFRDRMRIIGEAEYVDKGILIEDVITHTLPQRLSELFIIMKKGYNVDELVLFLRENAYSCRKRNDVRTQYHSLSSMFNNKEAVKMEYDCGCSNNCYNLTKCKKFVILSVKERQSIIAKRRVCFRCLKVGHKRYMCPQYCNLSNRHNHHTLLRIPIKRHNEMENTNVNTLQVKKKVRLPVVMIEIQDWEGLWRQVRALIDSGSDTSLRRKDLVSQLGLNEIPDKICYEVAGGKLHKEQTRKYHVIVRCKTYGKSQELENKLIYELEENEFIQEVNPKDNKEGFYLNIRGVLKTTSKSTPLRIVCNSPKEVWPGFTYNDCFEKGPDLTNRVIEVPIRFRRDKVAFHGAISKKFNRIFIKDDDRKCQRIVGRNADERANSKTYEWTRLIIVDKPSPDLSRSAVRFIAEKYANEFSEARRVLFEDTYVDDVATSVESDEAASKIMMDVDCVLQCGVLGHNWDVESDYIRLGVRGWPNFIKVNKRTILSAIARIWDPLGIVPSESKKPAGGLTKHITVNDLKIWHQGPSFLYSEDWPEDPQDIYVNVRKDLEIKENKHLGKKCRRKIGTICVDFEKDDSLKTLGVKSEDTLLWKDVLHKVNKEDNMGGKLKIVRALQWNVAFKNIEFRRLCPVYDAIDEVYRAANPLDEAGFFTPNSLLYGERIIVDQLEEAESSYLCVWKAGIVTKTYSGEDGFVRKVKIRASTGEYDCPISKLCLLATGRELEDDSILQKKT